MIAIVECASSFMIFIRVHPDRVLLCTARRSRTPLEVGDGVFGTLSSLDGDNLGRFASVRKRLENSTEKSVKIQRRGAPDVNVSRADVDLHEVICTGDYLIFVRPVVLPISHTCDA